MRLCSPEQPYPGLRPFEPQEAEYFCGRKQEIHRLEGMIQEQRFIAVLGSSGAGKSSLVLAGVLPRLVEEPRLSTGEPSWQVLRMRPGGAPFRALADKAAELACRLHPEQAVSGTAMRDRALGLLRRGSQGLRQVVGELGLASGVRLLLIVDQFEELFRYKGIDQHQARREDEETRDHSDEAAAFATALLAPREGNAPPVHVVITMRSDFVGEAARFLELPEAIDAGQFLVPRMSRAQMEAAVREPLKLAGATISPALVQRLLNDTGTEPDALPMMQHALLRTWEEAPAESKAPAPGQDRGEMPAPVTSGRKLLPRHYEAAGTMAHALSQHANAILDKLGEEDRELPEVARWLFRALADVDKEGRAIRRPQRYAELVVLVGTRRRKQVRSVLDRFRADDCHFLTPFISALPRLKAETVIDVAHEALLRNWDKLRGDVGKVGWLAEEFEDGLIWRGLAVQAEMFAKNPKCTLGAVTAKRQEQWLAGLPSPYWMRRHTHPVIDTAAGPKQDEGSHEWHRVSRLITASSRAADRQERWRQITLGSAALVAVVMLVLSVFAWRQASHARQQQREAQRQASLFLAEQARGQTAQGNAVTGIHLALRGLPTAEAPDRELMAETAGALVEAIRQQRERYVLRGHENIVRSVTFSPDGTKLASASYDQTVRLWEVATGKEVGVLRGHEKAVLSVAFSPDGTKLASASDDQTVRLWEVATGKEVGVLRGHENAVLSVTFSPDGTKLASASYDQTVRLWEVATGKEVGVLRGHEKAVLSVAFSPDGTKLASASEDQTVRLWEVATGQQVGVLRGHEDTVLSVAFSPDGTKLASASRDFTVRLWEVATSQQVGVPRGHENVVLSVAFSPDGTKLASAPRDSVRLWEVATGKEVGVLRGHENAVLSVAFSPDGTKLASASDDQTVRLWEVASEAERMELRGHEKAVRSVTFSPDGTKLASASYDQTVRLWEVATGKEVGVLRGHEDIVLSVAFSPDGTKLASASDDQTVRLWEVATGKEVGVLRGHENAVLSVAFSPDGTKLASASDDQTVRLWEVASEAERMELRGHEKAVRSVTFSPDGTKLASASYDQTVRLWEVATGKEVGVLRGHENIVRSVAFSPDGTKLASASDDQTVRLWEVATGQEVGVLRGHEKAVRSVAFSPDGTKLASASEDHTVRLWEVASGKERMRVRGHDGIILDVAWSRDSAWLATAGGDKLVRLWPMGRSIEELIAEAQRHLPRQLTEAEERRFYCAPLESR